MPYKEQTFQTADGKTIAYNPNTGEVELIAADAQSGQAIPQEILTLFKNFMPPGIKIVDFQLIGAPFVTGQTQPATVQKDKIEDVLGSLDYYVLVPTDKAKYLTGAHVPINSWVTEHKNGHHPEYQGHKKYRIMPEQFEWLKKHKDCKIVAYYTPECPVFVSVACQDHAKVIRPIMPQAGGLDASKGLEFSQTISVTSQQEAISSEEREI